MKRRRYHKDVGQVSRSMARGEVLVRLIEWDTVLPSSWDDGRSAGQIAIVARRQRIGLTRLGHDLTGPHWFRLDMLHEDAQRTTLRQAALWHEWEAAS
jgi:hypothetical protein